MTRALILVAALAVGALLILPPLVAIYATTVAP